ncbi:hypothetical protein [Pseudomonas capsici]|uniref:hypothetical protein n=1 Tax=Pseudomonas capsici TaxID=2810614 RepID=UPI000E3DAC5E|nr:hypothetical protein [Pseudomonas capsici]MCV4284375.1 hypothetical protein [Pseudomonas capsici]
MATQYIQNGNFSNDFEHWKAATGFEPDFKPHGDGQSILLPVATVISQSLPDLPGKTLRIEFDACSADNNVAEAIFVVSVGGFNVDGTAQVSPVSGVATPDWQRFTVNMYFQENLTYCFLNVSTPRPASTLARTPSMSPVRFGDFSLVEAE